MNKKICYIFIFLLIFTLSVFAENELVMDSGFFKKFSSHSIISRDDYLEGYINGIIIGRGKITSVAEKERYKKKYRVIIESSESSKYNQKFIYYLFMDNKNTVDLLTVDSDFEFKGQFMGYTPLSTKRNGYIIDVVLMDASTVIE